MMCLITRRSVGIVVGLVELLLQFPLAFGDFAGVPRRQRGIILGFHAPSSRTLGSSRCRPFVQISNRRLEPIALPEFGAEAPVGEIPTLVRG